MKVLNLERINRNTHYTVFANADNAYIFYTRQGIVYEVSFAVETRFFASPDSRLVPVVCANDMVATLKIYQKSVF